MNFPNEVKKCKWYKGYNLQFYSNLLLIFFVSVIPQVWKN